MPPPSVRCRCEKSTCSNPGVFSNPLNKVLTPVIAVKGIGPWTADLFLMACGRLDAFPEGDVGLMESYRLLSESAERLDAESFSALADDWRPYRGVAAHLLWAWINAERARTYAADGGG